MLLNEYTNREIGILLKNLGDQMQIGFEGVHARQNLANHGISKNKEKIEKLENWRWYIIGGGSVIMFGLTFAVKFL